MFTKTDLYRALKRGDRSKQNFLTVTVDNDGRFEIKVIPKGETDYRPDENGGPVVVCLQSFLPDRNFIGPEAEQNKLDVEDLYKRLIYMYLVYRVTGARSYDEPYDGSLIKVLKEDLAKLNAEVEGGISCLMREMNS